MVNSKKRVLVISLSALIFGLLAVTVFALLNSSGMSPRELKTFALILLLFLAAGLAFLLVLAVFKKTDSTDTAASDAIDKTAKRDIQVSDARLLFLQKGYAEGSLHKPAIERLAQYGECLPAIVVSIEPLLVSVYSEKTECAEVYRFPNSLLEKFIVVEGSHLVAAASYPQKSPNTKEPDASAFNAVILNFVSEDTTELSQLSFAFPMRIWRDAITYGENLVKEHPERIRSGDPALIK